MKATILSIIVAVGLVGGTLLLTRGGAASPGTGGAESNVSVTGGVQTIDIAARGGYSPRVTVARAGMPTIIRMNTKGTFDCSAALVIPRLGYRANLPPTGETIIEVPPQEPGNTIEGVCAMGMYGFSVRFE